MKNKKGKENKGLKFICPKCGHTRVECCEANAYVTSVLKIIDESGDHSYEAPIIEDSDTEAFQCVSCGFRPQDKHRNDINNCVEFAKWVKKHCKQD